MKKLITLITLSLSLLIVTPQTQVLQVNDSIMYCQDSCILLDIKSIKSNWIRVPSIKGIYTFVVGSGKETELIKIIVE